MIGKTLTAVGLLIIAASSASAATYTYSLLGYAYDDYVAAPIQARDGLIYDAGQNPSLDYGMVFNSALGSSANVNTVYVFGDANDGGLSVGGVVEGPDGKLYGNTGLGGTNNQGVIYSITGLSPTVRGTETPLFNFGGASGISPQDAMVFDTDGNLYGTAYQGGKYGAGIFFRYNVAGNVFTDLHDFGAETNCIDGAFPESGPVQGTDGNFYGAAEKGGNGCGNGTTGTIYSISPTGTFNWAYDLCCQDGANPNTYGALVEYSDGYFYGMTSSGGANNAGTIFKISSSGTYTKLYDFNPGNGSDGGAPLGGLIVGSDGNFYGTTQGYGSGGYGTVFQFTPAGSMTTLYSFNGDNYDASPYGGLIQGSDGNLYGVTSGFNEYGGYVYEIAVTPALPAPVELSFTPSTVAAHSAVTINWQVLNAFSKTLQNCIASVQGSPAGAGTWSGLQAGAYSGTTKRFSGSAAITPSAAGTYTYALTCGGQESGFATLTVTSSSGKATPTVALAATPNPATIGETVTLRATASGAGATPSGTVSFLYGSLILATVPLASGVASISPSTAGLPAGNYLLTASYSGDANYNAAVSAGYTVTLSKATPAVSLSATPNPAAVGQAITIKATAAGSGAVPTGTVAIKYGALSLVSLPLSGGAASFSPSTAGLPAGTYDLTASYSGDANYAAANSAAYGVTLSKSGTATTLTATPNPVTQGAACTLKATVTRSGDAGTATGSVRFSVGATTIATVALNGSGSASISPVTTYVPPGSYPIVATYSGDGGDSASASAPLTVVVSSPYDY